MNTTIALKGWKDENNITPMLLLAKKEREKIGIDIGQPVKVIHKVNKDLQYESIALVQRQFKEFVGEKNFVCSVNKVLADRLNVDVGHKVAVTKELTESEYKRFMQDLRQTVFFGW